MHSNIRLVAVTLGLVGCSVASSSSQAREYAPSGGYESAPIAQPEHHPIPSLEIIKSLGSTASPATPSLDPTPTAIPTIGGSTPSVAPSPAITNSHAPSLPRLEDMPPPVYDNETTLSPKQLKEQQTNARYMSKVLLPAIATHGWEIVKPINTDIYPVNKPNNFLVKVDDSECVMQFTVRDSQTDSPGNGTHNIVFVALAPKKYLSDGRYYGNATYRYPHNEGWQFQGLNFKHASEAIRYIIYLTTEDKPDYKDHGMKNTYNRFCK